MCIPSASVFTQRFSDVTPQRCIHYGIDRNNTERQVGKKKSLLCVGRDKKKKLSFFFCVTTNTAAANQFDIYNAQICLLLLLYSNSSLFKVYVYTLCVYAPVVLLLLQTCLFFFWMTGVFCVFISLLAHSSTETIFFFIIISSYIQRERRARSACWTKLERARNLRFSVPSLSVEYKMIWPIQFTQVYSVSPLTIFCKNLFSAFIFIFDVFLYVYTSFPFLISSPFSRSTFCFSFFLLSFFFLLLLLRYNGEI